MGKQFVNTDQNGWTWITRNKNSKPIGNPYHKDLENIATSFYVTNMPPALTSKGLWNVCASHGRLVDAFIANKLSKGGKRFGFIKFLGVKDANSIVNSMSNIWIGSFHLYITLALNQRLNTKTLAPKYTQSQPKPTNAFTTTNNQNAFPTLNNIATNNTPPKIKTHQPKPSYSSTLNYVPISTSNETKSIQKRTITLTKQETINVENTDTILLVKLKDIDSMENIDMSAVRNAQERFGITLNSIEADHFNSFIDSTGLVDLPIGGRSFTWMNKAGTKLSKLDRFLISEEVAVRLLYVRITALDRLWSDHNPILLHIDKTDFGPSLFKLYNSWLLRDGFDNLIKEE
ncbi:RNA-directed DNA polymerase, eukaryota, reverse transcriptase zinc-binding domain protein [Tanacetum coccineum]|uniref:RNA-directed DNA polymerase, eukaryota, reverse transcriptase zinc-binding domain protein n=1 Tax=Tanacetum coccineum TaxID=301880 RepID=A0ABQ4YCT5_9ASTR